ncbi:epoxyqueuosine reductase [Clostridia bacterium]|nr:epoxyqueuosine reductase [Clostridia bacterium]
MFGDIPKDMVVGVCSPEPFDGIKGLLANTPFVRHSQSFRVNPRLTMSDCKSIIVVGKSYNRNAKEPADEILRGRFSLFTAGTDYHLVMKNVLLEIAEKIGGHYQVFVDTGALVEKELLLRANLAVLGKNFLAISPKLGSMFNAGYILTDIYAEDFGEPPAQTCGNCTLCRDACPTGAIGERFVYEKCISYITQKKGVLSESEGRAAGNHLYGCDICQTVCPHNKGKQISAIDDTDEIYPDLEKLLKMTKKDFDDNYKNKIFYYKGLGHLKRNAENALKNIRDRCIL